VVAKLDMRPRRLFLRMITPRGPLSHRGGPP
jgi:hypothetical protein